MCELMGLSLSRPASAHFSIREFGGRDDENVDGWGLAWYPDKSVALAKEPVSWRSSQHTDFLERYSGLVSSIYIGHVRYKTIGGEPTHADTHPFVRELGGRKYAFAHNGTLRRLAKTYQLSRFRPLGTTDSEFAFCHLLERIGGRGDHVTTMTGFRWLHRELASLNEHGELNCVVSDGTSLFVYRDSARYKGLVLSALRTTRHELREFTDHEMICRSKAKRRRLGPYSPRIRLGERTTHGST
jgi:predicted glutamine amidotransferase